MMTIWHFLSLACAFLCLVCSTNAIPACPRPFRVSQPDGSNVTLVLRGDERSNYFQDKHGFTVVPNQNVAGSRPLFVYAAQDPTNGQLMSTELVVGAANPAAAGLLPNIQPISRPTLKPDFGTGTNPFSLNETSLAQSNITSLGNGQGLAANGTLIDTPISPHLLLGRRGSQTEDGSVGQGRLRARRLSTNGTIRNFVLMIRWADCRYQERKGTTPGLPTVADLDKLFNGPSNSLRDYFRVNSQGKLDLVSSFSGWITVKTTESEAADGTSGFGSAVLQDAIRAALTTADSKIDFNAFDSDDDLEMDMLAIVHSGYGAEYPDTCNEGIIPSNRIWSHAFGLTDGPWVSKDNVQVTLFHITSAFSGSCGTELGKFAVVAHESAHYFGLPDLYDLDGFENNGTSGGRGLGSYSLMGNAWGFDGLQNFPPLLDAWSRVRLNFVNPIVINSPGSYSIRAAALAGSQIYKITKNFPDGEYLLIENRQPMGYEAAMPKGGLAIYHVDESLGADFSTQGWPGQPGQPPWPRNGKHYQVALIQADGLFQLETTQDNGDASDLWYMGDGGKTILGPTTNPNTWAYQRGQIQDTGIVIRVTSPPGQTMTFTVTFAKPASCSDGIQNLDERGIDCEGGCPAKCPTCFDRIQNQGELGIDCGKPCPQCSVSARVSALSLSQTRPSATANLVARASVRVLTPTNQTVAGALVTVRFSRTVNGVTTTEFQTGNTTAAGVVTIQSARTTATVDTSLVACVINIAKRGLMYNATANLVSCVNANNVSTKKLVLTLK